MLKNSGNRLANGVGGVYAGGIGSSWSGTPLDGLVIDDPHKDRKAVDSLVQRDDVWDWYPTGTARLSPGGPVILILTRWHYDDLAGQLMREQPGEWELLHIPAQADPEVIDPDPLGRAPGEFLASAQGWTTAQWEKRKKQHKLLIVAPMSGHYATLLRGTVESMLPHYDTYITDWVDARGVPMTQGPFDLDDYVDYVTEFLQFLGPDTSVMAVCQPSVPVMAAVALMNAAKDPAAPKTMILMGGPIDTRRNPTAVNNLAQEKGVEWFRKNVIMKVPAPHAGMMRDVYPGFLQLGGFMTMNLDRHLDAHRELFWHLVDGDGDSAEKHRDFYDEYMSVMDLTAEFYLQTVEKVFVSHDLPKGTLTHRNSRVDPSKIKIGRAHV